MHERDASDLTHLGGSVADLGDFVARIAGPQSRERDVAEWTIARDVVRRLDDYEPGSFHARHPGGWSQEEQAQIDGLKARGGMALDDLRDFANGNPYAFGKWRQMVTDFEERDASKLRTLWWAFYVFERLVRLEGADTEQINALQMRIADCLRIRWRAHLDKIPGLDVGPVAWSLRGARRVDLLPKLWRWV